MSAPAAPECTVLLVEDVEADAHLTRMAFLECRLKVNLAHVRDGREAIDYLTQQPPWQDALRPDLILLDLNMPRMDGREFLGWIKDDAEFSAIPVIVLTTSVVERDVLASYRTGAAGYIIKPLDMEQFIDAIRCLQDYWFTLVRLPKDGG